MMLSNHAESPVAVGIDVCRRIGRAVRRSPATRTHRRFSPLLPAAILFLLSGCASTPTTIPTDLTAKEYFQRAQEAVVERGDYKTALRYYETFLDRYSEEIQLIVEAEYEIAFIHYKLGELELAREQFQALLARYESDDAQLLPRWPLVLAEQVLSKIGAAKSTAEE